MTNSRKKQLQRLIDDRFNGNQADLARAIKKAPAQVNHWLTGYRNMGDGAVRNIELMLNLPTEWLDKDLPLPEYESANVTPALDTRGRVPVISWVQAGDWQSTVDNFHPGHADEWVDITCPQKAHTFALRVKGDSMVNPNGAPSFPEGFILVVEPEMDFVPGDFVIAMNGDEEATFKQIVKDGGDWYLKPLNPRYPLKPLGNAEIVGVVREAILKFK